MCVYIENMDCEHTSAESMGSCNVAHIYIMKLLVTKISLAV